MNSGLFLDSRPATTCNPASLSYHYAPPSHADHRLSPSSKASSRKRNRDAVTDDELALSRAGHSDEGPTKPRRVDPSKLALRLDPDLVKEMDKFIIPGALMPSFTIRKELQQRYNVDRRHLYDYFHSRGLRVAKEDKFNNLARSRLAKAREEEMNSSQPAPDCSENERKPAKKTKNSHEKSTARAPFSSISSNVVAKKRAAATQAKSYSGKSKPQQTFLPKIASAMTRATSPSIAKPSVERADPPAICQKDGQLNADYSFDSRDAYHEHKEPDSPQDAAWSFDLSHGEAISDDDSSLELQYPETPEESQPIFADLNTQEERQNFYNTIIECIGPISPIVVQESVGSYKAFMETQHLNRFSDSIPKITQPSSELCSCISGLPSGPCLACGVESQPNYAFPPDVFHLESTFFTDEVTSVPSARDCEALPLVPLSSVPVVQAAPEIPWLNARYDGTADLARLYPLPTGAMSGVSAPSVNGSAWWLLAPYSGVSV